MKRLRTHVRELEQRLAALEEAQVDAAQAAVTVMDELRSADRVAGLRANGIEDSVVELRQRVAGALGWPTP